MSIRVPATAEMEDGRVLKVVIDQRDYTAVEEREINPVTHRNTYVRFVVFSALTRTKQYGGTWEQFGTECVEAVDGEPEESSDADRLDPGRQAASGGA